MVYTYKKYDEAVNSRLQWCLAIYCRFKRLFYFYVDLSRGGLVSSHNLIGQRLSDTYRSRTNPCADPDTHFRVFGSHESWSACPSARARRSRRGKSGVASGVWAETVTFDLLFNIYSCSPQRVQADRTRGRLGSGFRMDPLVAAIDQGTSSTRFMVSDVTDDHSIDVM